MITKTDCVLLKSNSNTDYWLQRYVLNLNNTIYSTFAKESDINTQIGILTLKYN